MQKRSIDWLTYAMLGLVIVFWAGNAIIGRAVRDDIDPVLLALLRWIAATVIIAPFAWRGLAADLPALKAGWKPVLALCLTGIVGFNTLLYIGLHGTTATNALLMQATIPGLVLLIGAVAFAQREPGWKIFGILLSVFGAAFTIFRGSHEAVLALRLTGSDLIVLAACVSWASYTALLRLVPDVRPASFVFVTFAGGALVLAAIALVFPGHHVSWNVGSILGVAYIGIFPSVIAYFLFNAAVARAGPAIAGQAVALMPIVGALLAALLLGEALHWYHAVGIVIVIAGVVIAGWADVISPSNTAKQ
ncbi:DMT family transporter [Croceicoccus bisphenolivorans]|uniref:DMT family transporter n=1 Tax=Croceicoccus bisphenolivorans TaxID=1783232 RepID=UPI00082B0EAE|nr:DMT family transporter [Croceicoccus bisphenolivorans]